MSSPPAGSRDPHAEPERGPGVVLVCQSCDHTWEPSLADLAAGPVPCTHCDGWTMIGELAEPAPATSRPQHTSLDPRPQTGHYELGTEEPLNLRVLAAFDELTQVI